MKSARTSLLPLLLSLASAILLPATLRAQSIQDSGLTAQEYLDKGAQAFLSGKYEETIKLYQEFETQFGKSTEAAPLLRNTYYRLAMSFIHLKKFEEAILAIETALAANPPLQKSEIEELTFWLGAAQLQEEEFESARATLEKFLSLFPPGAERNPAVTAQSPAAVRIPEARILIGTAWLLEEKFREAADYYAALKPGTIPDDRGRATVLRLYALLQDNDDDAAMELIAAEFARMADIAQLVTFQTLTLELGNRFLEKGEYRKAISCLQRVWTSERLLRHQTERLKDLESRLQAVEANPKGDPYAKLSLSQTIQKVKRELENFEKIPSFDAALRLRLATAYQAMKRYREAALIMEEMLATLPADPVVEQASVSLVQSWFEIERWQNAIEAAQGFAAKFPASKSLPLVLYLEGLSLQKLNRYDEAVAVFDTILKKHPASEFAGRALFMRGFTQLLAEKNTDAIATFEEFPAKYPSHDLAEAALYWRGMGYSLDKQFEKARDAMDEYLRRYPEGAFAGSAVFRKAYCAQQMEDYTTSIRELRGYLRKYPGHEEIAEARVLLGDALMNEGEMEEGMAAFKGIPREETRFYEEGVFKTAKALKLMEEHDRLLALMEEFQAQNPRSSRVAEAVYQAGWVYRQREQPEKARELYWAAITAHGDDPAIRSVDDLFPALARLYRGDAASEYEARLRDLREEAVPAGKKTLQMRTLWAEALAIRKTNPARAQDLLLQAAALADVSTTNPLLLADFAAALDAAGKKDESIALYRDLVKWNPRAPQKDRALAALGFAELAKGNEKAALGWFDRFARETTGSRETGRVLLAKAQLLTDRGQKDAALAALNDLLASEYATGQEKAEALYRIGDVHLTAGKPSLAIPYFQRIYVMHGRWQDWVAKAYLASGLAFEKLNDTDSARRTYQEFAAKEELGEKPESAKARERLKALGGPLPEPAATPAQG